MFQPARDADGHSRSSLIDAALEAARDHIDEHEQLRRLGIRYGQGYHYARPSRLEEL